MTIKQTSPWLFYCFFLHTYPTPTWCLISPHFVIYMQLWNFIHVRSSKARFFGRRSTCSKEIIVFCEYNEWQFVKKWQNLTWKMKFLRHESLKTSWFFFRSKMIVTLGGQFFLNYILITSNSWSTICTFQMRAWWVYLFLANHFAS